MGNASTKALCAAAEAGDVGECRRLLDKGVPVSKAPDNIHPLLVAADRGHTAVVALLLHRGTIVNVADKRGNTPLLRAAYNGHSAVVTLLLNKGVSVDTANNAGFTPLSQAVKNGHPGVVALLLEHGASVDNVDRIGETPLLEAVRNGHAESVSLLLRHGANADKTDRECHTPLLKAAGVGKNSFFNLSAAMLLLEHGASADRADAYGSTPLLHATWNGRTAFIQALLAAGADFIGEGGRRKGETALFHAAKFGEKGYVVGEEGYAAVPRVLLAATLPGGVAAEMRRHFA